MTRRQQGAFKTLVNLYEYVSSPQVASSDVTSDRPSDAYTDESLITFPRETYHVQTPAYSSVRCFFSPQVGSPTSEMLRQTTQSAMFEFGVDQPLGDLWFIEIVGSSDGNPNYPHRGTWYAVSGNPVRIPAQGRMLNANACLCSAVLITPPVWAMKGQNESLAVPNAQDGTVGAPGARRAPVTRRDDGVVVI